jgi:hypothetical protein
MGLFGFIKKTQQDVTEIPDDFLLPGLGQGEAALYACVIIFLFVAHWTSKFASRKGVRELDMESLNRVVSTKEILGAYLGAALLEPLMTIAGSEEITRKQLIVNTLQLLGLMAWTYLLFDAFDTSDVQQAFVYRKLQKEAEKEKEEDTKKKKEEQDKAKGKPVTTPPTTTNTEDGKNVEQKEEDSRALLTVTPWLTVTSLQVKRSSVIADQARNYGKDMALWFMLSGIFAALSGVVTHREAVHCYAIVILWAILHHQARAATVWVTFPTKTISNKTAASAWSYIHTFLSPAAALMVTPTNPPPPPHTHACCTYNFSSAELQRET